MALELIVTDQAFTTEPDTPGAALAVISWHVERWSAGAPYCADTEAEVTPALDLLRRTV